MWPGFRKASLAVLAGYAAALLVGWGIDFRFALWAVPLLQIGWGAFGIIRLAQLLRRARRPAQAEGGRESFGFALGGLLSSCLLSLVLLVLTQAD